jgi:hypothetical protein
MNVGPLSQTLTETPSPRSIRRAGALKLGVLANLVFGVIT